MNDSDIIRAYTVDLRTLDSIAKEIGSAHHRVAERLRRLGVTIRPRGSLSPAQAEIVRLKVMATTRQERDAFPPRNDDFIAALEAADPHGFRFDLRDRRRA
jgi:hypothetical protein